MKNYIKLLLLFLVIPFVAVAQDSTATKIKKTEKLERPAFESATLIDNQTNVLYQKNTLEIVMDHRFGMINGGSNDMAGFWGSSNIQIGLTYAILDRLMIGYSTTKFDRLQDFNWKVALLRQTRSNSMPISVTYYGNFTISALKKDNFNLVQDRYSFFNQIIIAKKFNPNLSLQLAPSVSHYNVTDKTMPNDVVAVAFGGRMKISPQTAIIFDYTQPVTKFGNNQPKPGISIGTEFSTSGHAFQIMLTNYNGLVQQKNVMFNQNNFFNGDFMIGFNITRLYNF